MKLSTIIEYVVEVLHIDIAFWSDEVMRIIRETEVILSLSNRVCVMAERFALCVKSNLFGLISYNYLYSAETDEFLSSRSNCCCDRKIIFNFYCDDYSQNHIPKACNKYYCDFLTKIRIETLFKQFIGVLLKPPVCL